MANMKIHKCALCGASGMIETMSDEVNFIMYYYVTCSNENCDQNSTEFYSQFEKDAKEKSITEWNTYN